MNPSFEEALTRCDLGVATELAIGWVREQPSEPRARCAYFTVLAFAGAWSKADAQLGAWVGLQSSSIHEVLRLRHLVGLEMARTEAFAGRRDFPLPDSIGDEDRRQAGILRRGYAEAPVNPSEGPMEGLPGQPVAWLVDGECVLGLEDVDTRFGGLLEVFLPSGYLLLPMRMIHRLELGPLTAHWDLLWRRARVDIGEGGIDCHLPGRYPGSEHDPDSAVRLARATKAVSLADGSVGALGQRCWVTLEPEGVLSMATVRDVLRADGRVDHPPSQTDR